MPRRLRRAAALGATALAKRGAARAQAAEQQAAPPPPVPEQEAAPVDEVDAPPADMYGELMKLKELLDAGVLTQAEFDAQKQKVLGS